MVACFSWGVREALHVVTCSGFHHLACVSSEAGRGACSSRRPWPKRQAHAPCVAVCAQERGVGGHRAGRRRFCAQGHRQRSGVHAAGGGGGQGWFVLKCVCLARAAYRLHHPSLQLNSTQLRCPLSPPLPCVRAVPPAAVRQAPGQQGGAARSGAHRGRSGVQRRERWGIFNVINLQYYDRY